MRSQITLLTYLVICASCQFNSEGIGEHQMIKGIFNKKEISELNKIIIFFNNSICKAENLNNDSVLNCYKKYFERMWQLAQIGDIQIQIPFEQQQDFMENHLDSMVFNQIWYYGKTWIDDSDTIEIISFRLDGKYMEFLKEFGKESLKAKFYHERIEATGGISASTFGDILMNYEQYDVKDERMKLLIAIHYLTLNEELITNEKFKAMRPKLPGDN